MPFEAGAIPGEKRTPEARQPRPDLLSCFADLSCSVKEYLSGIELATPSVRYLSSGYGKMVHPLRHTPGQPWLASRVCNHPDFANRAAGRALHGLIQRFFCVR